MCHALAMSGEELRSLRRQTTARRQLSARSCTTAMSKLVVMGQGSVGLPVAVRASEVGYDVVVSTSTSTG